MMSIDRKAIKRLIFLLPILLCGCFHGHASKHSVVFPQSGDSISLLVVEGPHTLESGKPVRFVVRLVYTLNSYESAFLSLRLDEFSNPESCTGRMNESSGPDTPPDSATKVPIVHGTHEIQIPITWSGGANEDSHNSAIGQGTISFQSSLWVDRLDYRFLTRSFGTQYCQRFNSPQ
jgi:hypothetical protein